MADYRFVIGIRQLGKSATETYYHDAADLKEAGKLAAKLMAMKNAMLFTTTEWVGIRIGLADLTRQAQLYTPGPYAEDTDGLAMVVPSRGLLPTTENKNESDQPNACIQMVVRYNDTRSTKRYLAFVPDECITGRPDSVIINANGAFGDAYTKFQTYITGTGWGIRGRKVTGVNAEFDITKWVASDQAPNQMGAVLPLSGAPPLKVNDKVAIKGTRRKGTDKMSYNGTYRVSGVVDSTSDGTKTVYLLHSDGGNPASIKVNGKLQLIGYQTWPIQKWSWFRAGTHKRGVSFGASRGRRLTRVLLDP